MSPDAIMLAVNTVLLDGNPQITGTIASDRLDGPTARGNVGWKFNLSKPAVRESSQLARAAEPECSFGVRPRASKIRRPGSNTKRYRQSNTSPNGYPVVVDRRQGSFGPLPN